MAAGLFIIPSMGVWGAAWSRAAIQCVMVAAGLVAFLQFNGIAMALLVGGTSLFIHTLVGNLLLPYLTGKTSRMNPVAVFVGVIFWGWLWGIWGLLLGIPIMMVAKAICEHVEDLQPIGELLGD